MAAATPAAGPRPAYYAARQGAWRDWWTLLHPPYTAWHLSYVVIGRHSRPGSALTALFATLIAFFLAVGISRARWTNCGGGRCRPGYRRPR